MKRFVYALLILIGVVLLSIVSSLGVYHYENQKSILSGSQEDTLDVQEMIAQVNNPTFTSIDAVHQYYHNVIDNASIDSTFKSIPLEALINISQVIIGRQGKASVRDIVYEYRQKYRSLYQYIKPTETLNAVIKEEQNTPPPIRNADTTDVKLNE